LGMSGPLLFHNDKQCRPRFGDIWRCRRHVGDTSATCGAKALGGTADLGGTLALSRTAVLGASSDTK
jgi:hypothetical protein